MTKDVFVQEVMAKPVTIAKSAKLTEALDKMLEEGIDPLIATQNGGVAGTVSREAIAEKLGKRHDAGLAPSALHVSSVVDEDFTSVYPDQSINVLIPLLQRYKLVIVYDADHKLIGQVGAIDLFKKVMPAGSLADIMEKFSTIESDERVVHLRRRMLDDTISRFIVTENEKILGIVTETDVAIAMRQFRKAVEEKHQDHRIRNLLVKDIMSAPVLTIDRTRPVAEAVDLMRKKNISAIPVTDKGKPVGIVTRRALLKNL